jgi:hypothetical protein
VNTHAGADVSVTVMRKIGRMPRMRGEYNTGQD